MTTGIISYIVEVIVVVIVKNEIERMCINMITNQTLKLRRQELGLTQTQVASAVGVSVPAYRLWEYGGTKPTAENEAKLREVLRLGGMMDAKHECADSAV